MSGKQVKQKQRIFQVMITEAHEKESTRRKSVGEVKYDKLHFLREVSQRLA